MEQSDPSLKDYDSFFPCWQHEVSGCAAEGWTHLVPPQQSPEVKCNGQ